MGAMTLEVPQVPEDAAGTEATSRVIKRENSHIQEVFDRHVRDDKIGKLRALLSRAQAYSTFLADRMQEQIIPASTTGSHLSGKRPPSGRTARGTMEGEQSVFKQPALVTGGALRTYQLEGVQWLVSLYENGLNGILADEMGLGKTLQCIAFLAFLRERGVWGPFLVVAPLSTLSNWISELNRFAPSVPAVLFHGSICEREALRRRWLGKLDPAKVSVVVTSYEIAMKDSRMLGSIGWKYLIIDEGHRLKNLNCRLIKELKGYKSDNRLLMTGTPLHNNLTELWSLLNFLLPEIFTDVDDFLSWFNMDVIDEGVDELDGCIFGSDKTEMVAQLHAVLRPLLLRRLKSDVEKELPKKKEYILSAALSPLQCELYQAVLAGRIRDHLAESHHETHKTPPNPAKRTRPAPNAFTEIQKSDVSDEDELEDELDDGIEEGLEGGEENETSEENISAKGAISQKAIPNSTTTTTTSSTSKTKTQDGQKSWSAVQGLQNKIMQLRKVCNHPYLFKYPTDANNPEQLLVDEGLVRCSGKMLLLDQLLAELRRRKHKVLIFSQMSRMLDILQDYLELRGEEHCRIDGSVSQVERQQQVQRFSTDPSCGVFLLSTRAGGLGINLVSADTVIFYDSDWNPQMDLQAQDRVHRIGQTKPVLILRLSTSNTAEARMLARASAKRRLERLVIHKRKFKGREQLVAGEDRLIGEELVAILRGEDDEGQVRLGSDAHRPAELSREEIDSILDRSEEAFSRKDWHTRAVRTVPDPPPEPQGLLPTE